MRRSVALAAGASVLLVLSGLVFSLPLVDAQTYSPMSTGALAPVPATVVVNILNGAGNGTAFAPGFSPANITVVLGVNNTIEWKNNDVSIHTVYSTSTPAGASAFQSPLIPAGGNFTQTLTAVGVYQYHCSLHAWMQGSVTVLASTNPSPEFPATDLAATLFVAVAALVVVARRLSPGPAVTGTG